MSRAASASRDGRRRRRPHSSDVAGSRQERARDGEGRNRTGWEPGGRPTSPVPGRARDGEGRNRTGDTTIFSRVLYQLSYLAAPGDGSGDNLAGPCQS